MRRLLPFFILFFSYVATVSSQDFRVQITARNEKVPMSYFAEHGVQNVIESEDQLGLFRYFAGSYNTRDEADVVQKEMIAKGFPYAYVIDLAEQRILCGVNCPYFRNGLIFVKDTSARVQNIFYDFGRYSLNAEAKETLDQMAVILKSDSKLKMDLQGYTDGVGNAQANAQLAANRARSARNYMIAKGIRADRMFIKVYGEAEPYAPNTGDEGEDLPENRKYNRRVKLVIKEESGEVH